MTRRFVALFMMLVIGLSSVEILLPGEVDAASWPSQMSVVDTAGAATQRDARVDGACLCACGTTHAQVAVVADLIVPLGPYFTHTESVFLLTPVMQSVDPLPQFRPPRT